MSDPPTNNQAKKELQDATTQTKKQGFPSYSAKVADVRQWVVQWFEERDIAKPGKPGQSGESGKSGEWEWKCPDLAWNGRDLYTLPPSALERGLKKTGIDEYTCELIIKSILDQRKVRPLLAHLEFTSQTLLTLRLVK